MSEGFFTELKRRNVLRMAGLYLVGAWLITQVAGTLLPMFGAPGWIARSVVIVLAIGFVPAMVLGWAFELTPQGVKREADVPLQESIAPQTAKRMNRMILAVLALALAYFGFDKFVLAPNRDAALVADTKQVLNKQAAQKEAAVSEKSIAVLAFTDLSPGHDQEYFSDGIAEELLNALAKVKDLKVAGRTSSFSFKGKNQDLRTIGKALGVATVLEGSVRKQGAKVRITAQLIRTKDGFHLWSETYDGDLEDVFALQESIAQAITGKLQVILLGEQKTRLVRAGTTNTEAYALYLQASAIFNRRQGARFDEAIGMLKQAIALDPVYARAHSRLAAIYALYGTYSGGAGVSAALLKVQDHANKALTIDPALAEPHAALGVAFNQQRRHLEARQALARALELDPDDVTANFWQATQLIGTGYVREGNAVLDRTLAIDPLLPIALLWRGRNYVMDGDLENGERLLRRAAEGGLVFVGLGQHKLDEAHGDTAAAITSLASAFSGYFASEFPPEASAVFARSIYGDAQARTQTLALIDAYLATKPEVVAAIVPYVLLRSGQVGRALALAQDRPTSNDALLFPEILRRNSDVKGAPEFPEFARRTGLAELWDKVGAPDYCRKNDKGDYVCE